MAEHNRYYVTCVCSRRVPVKLLHAGTSTVCPSCNSDIRIPDTVTLKENSGDKYPLLSNIDKIKRTVEEREPPFDGLCHNCEQVRADFEVPIVLQTLLERVMADDGGVRLKATGVYLVSSAAEEYWRTTSFPLLLCKQCHTEFWLAASRHRIRAALYQLFLVALLVAFLFFASFNFELVAALAGVIWFVGTIAWIKIVQGSNKIDKFLPPWLDKIRWVPDAISDAAEYRVTIGDSKPHVK